VFGLFKKKKKFSANSIEEFWEWFVKNKSIYERFIDSENRNMQVYHDLTRAIHSHDSRVFPEITKGKDGSYILVLTPDGLKEGVKPVQDFAAKAPEIENWIIEKFRSPVGLQEIGMNGKKLDMKIIRATVLELEKENDLVHIGLYIPEYKSDEKLFRTMAFISLDHAIGEFNTITRVGHIDFNDLSDLPQEAVTINLDDLRVLIEENLY